MPIKVTNRTFSDEFNSGTTDFIRGNVSDIITATIDISYTNVIDASFDAGHVFYGYSSDNLLGINTSSSDRQCFALNSGLTGSYPNETQEMATLVGASIEIQDLSGSVTASFTVNSVQQNLTVSGASYTIVCDEATSLTATYNNDKIVVTEAITDCNIEYRFNGASNNSDYTPAVLIGTPKDNNFIPTFKTTNSPLDATSGTDTIPFKYTGAYENGSLTIQGTGINSYVVGSSTATSAEQTFQLVHTVRATPIGIYNNGTIEPSSFNGAYQALQDNSSAGAIFNTSQGKYSLRGYFSNQVNGGIQIPFETQNYNQSIAPPDLKYANSGATNYSISSLSIVRTSDSEATTQPLIQEKFTVSFDIDNATDTPFSDGNTKVKVGIENLPDSIDNTEDYEQTFLSDYAISTLGAGAVSGSATGDAASITNYTATFNSTSSVTVSFDVEFTSGAQTQIEANGTRWIYIYAETQNHTLDYTNSDRVTLEVYSNEATEKILADPIQVNSTQFITSPYDSISQAVINTNVDGFPVQMLVGTTLFYADWTNRDDLRIDTITQKLVLKNSSSGEEIELDDTIIPVNSFNLIDSKYPDANYSVGKGYKIPTSEVRNLISLDNRIDLDTGDTHYFEMNFPFFIRWEDYTPLILTNTPSTLIDTAELNNGINYDLYRYDTIANWDIFYRITFESSEGIATFSQDFDYQITLSDYNSHPDVSSRDILLFKEDGVTSASSGGTNYIESTEKTLVQAEWTFNSAPSATTDFEIELFIEAYQNGSPVKIQRISSVNNLLSGSWWTDTGAGDGLVLKSIDGSKAVGKAYINDETLVNYDNYRIYGTIYNPKSNEDTLITENSEPFLTEAGVDNLIEE